MPVEVRAKKSWQNSTAGEELEEERRVREKRVAEGVSNFLAISAAGTHTHSSLTKEKGCTHTQIKTLTDIAPHSGKKGPHFRLL